MRSLVVLIGLLVAACPSSQHPGSGDDDGSNDGGAGDDGGPQACANPIPSCSVTIKFTGTDGKVQEYLLFRP